MEFRAIPSAAGGFFLEDPAAVRGLERLDLRLGILVFGLGDAGIAEQRGRCRFWLLRFLFI